MTTNEDFRALAQSYLEGIATPDQERRLMETIGADRESRMLFRTIEQEWHESHQRSADEASAFAAVLSKAAGNRSTYVATRRMKGWIAGLAASCAALAALLCLTLPKAIAPESTADKGFTVSSTRLAASKITLSDGTSVLLCTDSRFTCDSDFSPLNRKATLVGSGYFDVTSDREHPFTIDIDGCKVTVKGTKFSINSDDETIRATLIEGEIDFTAGEVSRKVLPGESLSYSKSGATFETKHINPEEYLALMEGRIEYYNVSLAELATRLEGLYGKQIFLDRSLSSNTLTVSMRLYNRETFEDVIDALKVMAPMSIRCEGDKVWLTSLDNRK